VCLPSRVCKHQSLLSRQATIPGLTHSGAIMKMTTATAITKQVVFFILRASLVNERSLGPGWLAHCRAICPPFGGEL